ncbi:MAG: hypothetical protein ACRCZM_05015 [Bacteroidales bacterium]
MKKTTLIFFAISLCIQVQAQEDLIPDTKFINGIAKSADWSRPFWADMHSTLNRAEVALGLNSPEYDFGKNGATYRPYVFANLGADFPLWTGNFSNGKFGITVTLPFMVDVWLDMFERSTAPVINVGYRFGAPEFSFIHRIQEKGVFKNYAIKFSPMKHECTHIGDELTIRRKNEGLPLTRINVSYNYTELQLTLNDSDGSRYSNHSFRAGFMLLHNFSNGWYNIMLEEGDVNKVVASKYPFETYFQYQYQTKTSKRNLQGVFSTEVRNRSKYNYPMYYTDNNENWIENAMPEFRSWSINFFVGVRYDNPDAKGYFSKIGIGIRAYNGINPYGQFRSQPVYQQLGLAIIFE